MLLQLKSINVLNDCKIGYKSDTKSKKIRERLKELSQMMSNWRIVNIDWNKKRDALVIALNNGIISSIYFNRYQHIISVHHDRYLVNKLLSEHIVNFIIRDNYILISYTQSKITFVSLNRTIDKKSKRKFKISNRNPNINSIELENGMTRRVERNLVINESGDLLIVWWKTGTNWVSPWSAPGKHLTDLANILVYSFTKSNFELITMSCVSGDIFEILFMKWNTNQVVLLQQSSDSSYVLNYCIFEINESFETLQQIYSIRIPLLRPCMKAQFTSAQDKIVLLCDDDSIMLFNIEQNALYSLHSSLNAFDFSCNQFDAIFSVADQFGRVSLYDYSLNTIPINYEELFNDKMLHLRKMKFIDSTKLCLYFNEEKATNITLITLPVIIDNKTLINEYIRSGKCEEAIAALKCINWNCYSQIAYFSLNAIFNHLIKQPLNTIRESQLETTLATFLTPIMPIDDQICQEYKLEMHYLAKRFFYHLLRYNCLDKAFLLGVDLKSKQLFILLYKVAKERGNERIANAAFLKSELHSRQEAEQCFPNYPILSLDSYEQNNNDESIVKNNSSPVACSQNIDVLTTTSPKTIDFKEFQISPKSENLELNYSKQMPIASILKPSSLKSKATIIATKPVTFSTFPANEPQNKQNNIFSSLKPESSGSPESLYTLSTKKKLPINGGNSSNSILTNDIPDKVSTEAYNLNDEIVVHSNNNFKRSSFSSFSSSCSSSSSSTFSSTSASTSLQTPPSLKLDALRLSPLPPELPPRTYLMKNCMRPPERPPKKSFINNNSLETEELDENYILRNDCSDTSVPINLSHIKSGSKIECIHFGVV